MGQRTHEPGPMGHRFTIKEADLLGHAAAGDRWLSCASRHRAGGWGDEVDDERRRGDPFRDPDRPAGRPARRGHRHRRAGEPAGVAGPAGWHPSQHRRPRRRRIVRAGRPAARRRPGRGRCRSGPGRHPGRRQDRQSRVRTEPGPGGGQARRARWGRWAGPDRQAAADPGPDRDGLAVEEAVRRRGRPGWRPRLGVRRRFRRRGGRGRPGGPARPDPGQRAGRAGAASGAGRGNDPLGDLLGGLLGGGRR